MKTSWVFGLLIFFMASCSSLQAQPGNNLYTEDKMNSSQETPDIYSPGPQQDDLGLDSQSADIDDANDDLVDPSLQNIIETENPYQTVVDECWSFLVGFEQPKAKPYDVKVTEKTIPVPLREFGDTEEVENRLREHSLKVWIERDGRLMEGVVGVIPASQLVEAPLPVPVVSPSTRNWVGFGRKKTAVAKSVLQNGYGEIKVNGQPIEHYFKGAPVKAQQFLRRLLELEQVREALSQMEARITVTGSSPTTTRQAKAVAHALATALMNYDSTLKLLLKRAGFGGVRARNVPTMEREE